MMPPGSRPGMMSLATRPTTRPNTIHRRTSIADSFHLCKNDGSHLVGVQCTQYQEITCRNCLSQPIAAPAPTGTGFATEGRHEPLRIVWSTADGRCRPVPASSLRVRRRLGRGEPDHVRLLPPEEGPTASGSDRARRRVLGAHRRGGLAHSEGGFARFAPVSDARRSLEARFFARAKPALERRYFETILAIISVGASTLGAPFVGRSEA